MPLRLVTPPASEPMTLTEVKSQCRVTHSDQDTLLTSLIAVARQYVEAVTGRAMVTQTWELLLDRFPAGDAAIRIPMAPVRSIVSVSYIDESGAAQTWDADEYTADLDTVPARIKPAPDYCYPATEIQLNAVTVRFTAGYIDTSNSPPESLDLHEPLKQAMLLKVQELYDGKQYTSTIDALCAPYKLWGF